MATKFPEIVNSIQSCHWRDIIYYHLQSKSPAHTYIYAFIYSYKMSLSIYIRILIFIQTQYIINISLRTPPKKPDTSRFTIPHPHFPNWFSSTSLNSGPLTVESLQNAETSGALECCHLSCAWRDECQLSTWLRTSTLTPRWLKQLAVASERTNYTWA